MAKLKKADDEPSICGYIPHRFILTLLTGEKIEMRAAFHPDDLEKMLQAYNNLVPPYIKGEQNGH